MSALIWLHEDALRNDHPVFKAAGEGAEAVFSENPIFLAPTVPDVAPEIVAQVDTAPEGEAVEEVAAVEPEVIVEATPEQVEVQEQVAPVEDMVAALAEADMQISLTLLKCLSLLYLTTSQHVKIWSMRF